MIVWICALAFAGGCESSLEEGDGGRDKHVSCMVINMEDVMQICLVFIWQRARSSIITL